MAAGDDQGVVAASASADEKQGVQQGPDPGTDAGDFTTATEPFALFAAWLAEAGRTEPNDPNAMALATADADGLPNVRMVLLKGVDDAGVPERGFVFYTNLGSAKAHELTANPKAALVFHWKSLQRQVRVRGLVTTVTEEEANAYFDTRPRLSRLGAWASAQSRPLESRRELEDGIADYTKEFGFGEIPRPLHWSGYRITPLEIEFWHDRPWRLHDRIVFRRASEGEAWTVTRLYP